MSRKIPAPTLAGQHDCKQETILFPDVRPAEVYVSDAVRFSSPLSRESAAVVGNIVGDS